MKHTMLIALCLCMTISMPSHAEMSSHERAALELLEVTEMEKTLDQMLASIGGVMEQQFTMMDLPPDGMNAASAIQEETMEWFGEFFRWEELRGMYVEIYMEVFSEEELREIIDFYRTPLGQKLLQRMPELLHKSMMKTQALLQERLPAFQKRLEVVIEELEEQYK